MTAGCDNPVTEGLLKRCEIVLHMMTCNERSGISYFALRELDDFEPVLRALR